MQSFVKTGKRALSIDAVEISNITTALKLFHINLVKVSKVSCSSKHTLICTNTGTIYGWGDNTYSQVSPIKED